jgi:PAS domain S-box-containing protein
VPGAVSHNLERFRNLVDCASDGIFTIRPDGVVDFVNVAAARIAGLGVAEVTGAHFARFVHPDDLPRAQQLVGSALAGSEAGPIDIRVVQSGGAVVVVEVTAIPERDNGSVTGVFGIARDVTARRAAEEHRIYGVDPAAYSPTFDHHLQFVHPDGTVRNIHGRITLHDADGDHPKLFGASQDVTELRRIELDLRRREQQFAIAQSILQAGSFEVDYDSGEVTWSDEVYAQLDYPPGTTPSTEKFAARLHADDAERVLKTYQRAFERVDSYAQEYRIIRSDGDVRIIHSEGHPVLDGEGRARKFVGVTQDITSRRAMENAAAEGRLRLQAIFDNVLEAIVLVDDDGFCVDANPAACRLAGASPEALAGRRVSECIAELEGIISGALPSSGELSARMHDGVTRDLEYRAVHGIIPGVHLVILRDISDRKRAERLVACNHARLRALARRMTERQENERQRIARELHDEIAQMMTAVMLGLQALRNITGDRKVLEKIEESVEIVESSLERARGLSLELRPAILDDLGLVAALRWYLDRQRGRGGWNLRFRASGIADSFRSPVCMACFRVAQEAIANVVRHANAREVDVELTGSGAAITLRVADDGVGFDVDSAVSSADRGLGLLGMQERVLLLDGEFRIRSQRGAGTEVLATFPLPAEGTNQP